MPGMADEERGYGKLSGSPDEHGETPISVSKKRTRTGCLNCRKKRRKCDERKPTCEGCEARRERCQYGIRVSFRPENAHTINADHASMRQGVATQRPSSFQIIDITQEVIRDYFEETVKGESQDVVGNDYATPQTPIALSISTAAPAVNIETPAVRSDGIFINNTSPPGANGSLLFPTTRELFVAPQTREPTFDDGIFLPGSQYQELHAALRSRLFDTARSTGPSRIGSPDLTDDTLEDGDINITAMPAEDDEESRRLAHLTPEQEYLLWQNYINEVSLWLDKFDNNRHFELVLPILAKSHPHLKYSILALSARQMERLRHSPDSSCSLALYQHAIHLLSPLLHKRTTVVLASCIVLCVLEMLSCSPKAWRRHLDGCAALIQALGISGSCGSSLEQALFWIFARIDICGGLISSEKTLIPITRWLGGSDMAADVAMLRMPGRFDAYANLIVYLCGQVVDFLCSSGKWEQQGRRRSNLMDIVDYNQAWVQLYEIVEDWCKRRPEEMKPLLTIEPYSTADEHSADRPFPMLLYANGPANSGNQMYHTAALLMLKYKPAKVHLSQKPRSIRWHARQICAISMSNNHHGCWTNSIQPLWLAGQQMHDPAEQMGILEVLQLIERETGWSTKWRQDDLKAFWANSYER